MQGLLFLQGNPTCGTCVLWGYPEDSGAPVIQVGSSACAAELHKCQKLQDISQKSQT